jgi:deazaflavin-dependent oxidoreductase (nitroreductase family)
MPESAFMRLGNQMTAALLRSPLHGILSADTMLITVTGRKSGNQITLPVGFVRDGDTLAVTSMRARQWWRNVRGGARVRMLLRGKAVGGMATVAEDERAVADGIAALLRTAPSTAKWYGITLDAAGNPDYATLDRLAKSRVIVYITLSG